MNKENKQTEIQKKAVQYTKAQILHSKQFTTIQKDFLKALLEENKKYSIDEAVKRINEFLKQEAK